VRENFPEVLVNHHEKNLGAAGGRNAASELAIDTFNPSHLLFMDNDTVVDPEFLGALLEPFDGDEKLAQTMAKIRYLKDMNRINNGGGSKIEFWKGSTNPIGLNEIDHGQYDKPTKCIAPTTCVLVRTDVFKKVGGFDLKFDPYGYEDLDLSLRIMREGYYGLYVPKALIYHDPSRTTFEDGVFTERYAKHKTRNWFLFMMRHASLSEKLSFIFIGVPFILSRMIVKESRKGNIAFFKGLFLGLVDFLKTPFKQ
jgi:GT2 family glycosyltransferase